MQVSAYASKHYPTGYGVPDSNISTIVVGMETKVSVTEKRRLAYMVGGFRIPLGGTHG